MMNMYKFVAVTLALLMATALGAADAKPGKSALDKATFEAYVRHLLLWGPQITIQVSDPKPSEIEGFYVVNVLGTAGNASQEQSFYVSKDGKQILQAAVYEIGKNPFYENYDKITTAGAPSMGTPGAPVRIVVFTDFECPYCRREAQTIRQNLLKDFPDQVRLYFKEFPIPSIHPWAEAAAVAGRCFYQQSEDDFWAYHDWIFDHQSEITADNLRGKILEFAGTLPNMDTLRLTQCLEGDEAKAEVAASVKEAQALGVNSTPTMFINGRRLSSQLPWANLKQVIQFEIDYQKTAHDAGDTDCCSVTLPTPLSQ